MPKVYHGIPEGGDYDHAGDVRIFVDGIDTGPLKPRLDLRNHSPTGFAWNYYGSGPAQLSLAILADAGEDDELATRFYQDYKGDVVAKLARGPWEISADSVREWLEAAKVRP